MIAISFFPSRFDPWLSGTLIVRVEDIWERRSVALLALLSVHDLCNDGVEVYGHHDCASHSALEEGPMLSCVGAMCLYHGLMALSLLRSKKCLLKLVSSKDNMTELASYEPSSNAEKEDKSDTHLLAFGPQ